MHKANVNDRASIEAAYPRAAFEEDAARNARGKTAVVYGIRIESAPDAQGWFGLVRAQQHTGEADGVRDTIFLLATEPHLQTTLLGRDPDGGTPLDPEATPEVRKDEYEAFLDRILETARSAEFRDPIGRGEERLRGFHGG